MLASLYSTSDDRRKLFKRLYNERQYNIELSKDTDIINPVLLMSEFDFNLNYVYIPQFNRYYFIDNVTVVRTNLYQLSCSVDVLMSNASQLNALNLLVERSEVVRQPYIVDNELVTRCDKDVITVNIGSVGASTSSFPYYLVTTGGGVVQ